jgi:hypothetical protein
MAAHVQVSPDLHKYHINATAVGSLYISFYFMTSKTHEIICLKEKKLEFENG